MNFPFTDLDFAGDDPSAPIIPSNGASAAQPRANSKTKKNVLDTSQVTNSKVNFLLSHWTGFVILILPLFEAINDSSKEVGLETGLCK